MQAKLTLRLDSDIARRAKSIAKKNGKSVSRMVSDYFALFDKQPAEEKKLTPIVKSLKGSLQGSKVDVKDYRRHLEEKYLP